MTDWSGLTHAYDTAQDVPGLLDQAGPDPRSAAWNDLWSCLCHQGTVYSASYAALPALAEKARQWSAPDRVTPLVLAAAILSSVDRPHDVADPRATYAAEIAELIELTGQAVQHPGLAQDPTTYVYLLQALLALEGIEVWGEHLDGLNEEEYEIPCPQCEAENFVVFGEHGYFTTLDAMYMSTTDAARIPLLPEHPSSLNGLARRLHGRALADGHPDLATKLTYVFGRAHCAECGALFRVDQAVVARWGT